MGGRTRAQPPLEGRTEPGRPHMPRPAAPPPSQPRLQHSRPCSPRTGSLRPTHPGHASVRRQGRGRRSPGRRSDHWSPAKGPAWLGGRWRWRWTTRARWQRLLRVLDTGPALRGASCSSSCWSVRLVLWQRQAAGRRRWSRSPCYSSPFPFSLACAAAPATAAARACARP